MRTTATHAATAAPEPSSQRLATEDYVDRRSAELEARLTWRLLGIVAAVKFIPPGILMATLAAWRPSLVLQLAGG